MSTSSLPAGLTLDQATLNSTLGALAIGFGFSCALFGVLTTQVWIYYRRFSHDTPFIMTMVGIIWVLELADQIFISHATYHYTVTLWANPIALLVDRAIWSLILQQTFGTLVGTFVKAAFTMRVWRFSKKNWIVTGAISTVIVLQFGECKLLGFPVYVTKLYFAVAGMLYTKQAFSIKQPMIASIPKLTTIATISLISGVCSDLLVALALAYYLSKLRTGYERSDNLINSLVRYGISTGFLSSAISLATLLLYHFRPAKFEFIATFFVLSKVLDISLMSSLNTRKMANGRTASHSNLESRGRDFGVASFRTGLQGSTTLKMSEFHAESWGSTPPATTSPIAVANPGALPGQYTSQYTYQPAYAVAV
ncbi:hypothetical protein DL96DRAFT_1677674 [Flagelloscypha sp. PMI_526]|nr:hypothetical protein DL96DRAFT_1677674 [Flagelloscypha sp. PMI_526]